MPTLSLLQYLLGAAAGSLVGFTLGLVGGGGSILAVPLMVYLVGVDNPHVAIGTSALAVAANAAANLLNHARRGNVKWPCASVFALVGVVGAFFGSSLGKAFDGQKLLVLFALLMLVVAALMLRGRASEGDVIDFDFVPDRGTTVEVNGRVHGDPIPGADLFQAVLGIFLGERPVDARLKQKLLGQ